MTDYFDAARIAAFGFKHRIAREGIVDANQDRVTRDEPGSPAV